MLLAYIALSCRIVSLGLERILVKKLGTDADSISTAFIFIGLSPFFLAYFAIPHLAYYPELWLIFISGIVYALAFILYSKSLSTGDASLVSPLYNFNVLFLLIISNIFLDEPITLLKITGILLMVYGISFLNKQPNILKSLQAVIYDDACRMMMMSSLLIAIGRIIDGYSVRTVPPVLYGFAVDVAMAGYLFLFLVLQKKLPNVTALFLKKPVLSLSTGALSAGSYFCLLYAFSKMDVSIVEPASMLSMIVTVLLARILLQEIISNRLIGVLIMLAGAWLLFL